MAEPMVYPEKLTPVLEDILSRMVWDTGRLARVFRKAGVCPKLPCKAEAEQAWILHWMICHALKHGEDWKKAAAEDIKRATDKLAEQNQ